MVTCQVLHFPHLQNCTLICILFQTHWNITTLGIHDITASDGSWNPHNETVPMLWYFDDDTDIDSNDYDQYGDSATAHKESKSNFETKRRT